MEVPMSGLHIFRVLRKYKVNIFKLCRLNNVVLEVCSVC